jgi:hypothetical protein
MKKGRPIFGLFMLLLLPIGCKKDEPTFQGKPLSEWRKLSQDADSATSKSATNALLAMNESLSDDELLRVLQVVLSDEDRLLTEESPHRASFLNGVKRLKGKAQPLVPTLESMRSLAKSRQNDYRIAILDGIIQVITGKTPERTFLGKNLEEWREVARKDGRTLSDERNQELVTALITLDDTETLTSFLKGSDNVRKTLALYSATSAVDSLSDDELLKVLEDIASDKDKRAAVGNICYRYGHDYLRAVEKLGPKARPLVPTLEGLKNTYPGSGRVLDSIIEAAK